MPTTVVNWDERPDSEQVVTDPLTGLPMKMTFMTAHNACRDCGGLGELPFATFSDYRAHVLSMRAYEQAVDLSAGRFNVDEPELVRSGLKPCTRCNGTGTYEGDGGLHRVRMELLTYINLLPPDTNPE